MGTTDPREGAPAGRPLCAICDVTNATMRLCRKCRADPANAGWSERTQLADRVWIEGLPTDRGTGELGARTRVAEMHDRRLRRLSVRTQQILQLVGMYQITVYVRPRGRARTRAEWIQQKRPLLLAEVAFLVGVTPSAVQNTLRRYESLLVAVAQSARRGGTLLP